MSKGLAESRVFSLPTSKLDRFQRKTSVFSRSTCSFAQSEAFLRLVRRMLGASLSLAEHCRQAKNTAKLSFCRVCHAEAKIFHYGSLSCYSCKTFFRRHALGSKVSSSVERLINVGLVSFPGNSSMPQSRPL